MAGTNVSKWADTLNALSSMQGSFAYAARRDVLRAAEEIIASQEKLLLEAGLGPQKPSELQQFTAMLERAGVGHGTRVDPAGMAVQVECDISSAVTDWLFDESGKLKEVQACE